jgi:hypothetical protein
VELDKVARGIWMGQERLESASCGTGVGFLLIVQFSRQSFVLTCRADFSFESTAPDPLHIYAINADAYEILH